MAGHSKFKNIMHRKGRADSARSKLFSKLSREITVAAKAGVPDPTMNARLRLAVANAKAESMSKDVIDRAIKKASGGEAEAYEEIRYEGFWPGRDRRHRRGDDRQPQPVRLQRPARTFTKYGGNLGETGSVSFMWDRVGQISYGPQAGSEDKVMEAAIEAGAEDVESDEDGHTIYTAFADLSDVATALEAALGPAKATALAWRPKVRTPISGDGAATLMKLLETLDDDDDVQNVYSNEDIDAAELEKLAG